MVLEKAKVSVTLKYATPDKSVGLLFGHWSSFFSYWLCQSNRHHHTLIYTKSKGLVILNDLTGQVKLKIILVKGSWMLVHLILLVAETAVALFFHALPWFSSSSPSYLFSLSRLSFLPCLFPLLCLDEWFSKGKILPFVYCLTCI